MEQERNEADIASENSRKRVKTLIIVLAVLLGLALAALSGVLIYRHWQGQPSIPVTVPDNVITPDRDPDGSQSAPSENQDAIPSGNTDAARTTGTFDDKKDKKSAVPLWLHARRSQENQAFSVQNWFPGDSETRYYRVRVSFRDQVTVRFRAEVRPGGEKLAEVLKTRVTLLTTGEVLYDGLMRDMPNSLAHPLSGGERTTAELYYEITPYLETSVGNEYQNRTLIADFRWWVEETGNLVPPQTGYTVPVALLGCVAAGSGILLLILLVLRRRREKKTEEPREEEKRL